jgi:hypothetical protein
MSTTSTLHITPEGEAWAVKLDEAASPSSVHPTQAQAVASAWDLVKDRDEAEVVIHHEAGHVLSSLTIRQVYVDLDEAEDAALRAEAMRRTPSYARLKAGIARRLPIEGADLEADPADLY